MAEGTNNLGVRKRNRQAVLKMLYQNQTMTRKDLADRLGLSFPTVTQILTELETEGLVQQIGQQASTGGRRAFLNAIVTDSRASVGVSISMHWVEIVLMNLGLSAVATEEYRMPFEDTEAYWQQLSARIEDLLDRHEVARERLLGVGLSFPGVISSIGNSLEFAPTLGIDRLDLGRVTRQLRYPVLFGNDATLASRAEAWFRPEIGRAAYLLLNRGVGGAYITDREDLLGSRACEFGHMVIQEDGKLCSCGRRGCLEAYCSSAVLVEETGTDGQETLEDFFARLEEGEELHRQAWDRYFGHLVTGIGNLRSIFDADVIIGGEMARFLERYAEPLRRALIDRSCLSEDGRYLRFGNYGQYDAAIGAALLHISGFLNEV